MEEQGVPPRGRTPTIISKGLSEMSWRWGEGDQLPQLLKKEEEWRFCREMGGGRTSVTITQSGVVVVCVCVPVCVCV